MRKKLSLFKEFADGLFPHEIDYLLSVQKFQKNDNLKILKQAEYNSKRPEQAISFDTSIDKRTYSYMKDWISESLSKIDVDLLFDELVEIEREILNDSISPDEEKRLIEILSKTKPSSYYFLKIYQVVELFRDYLLIRVRMHYYKYISEFLENNEKAYQHSNNINRTLNQAATEIILQHSTGNADPIHYSDFLHKTFMDNSLDAYTRYRASVRLTFMYYNYREFDQLRSVYDELDKLFKTEVFYSRRILANYYANRAMLHSKLNELNLAEKYGYLSIRNKNSDYLFYLANLCGVLLRSKKYTEALSLMSKSIPELKNTNSFYNKIGFVSFYIRTLVANKMVEKAVSYATTFFEAHRKTIFETRWHLFLSAYFHALVHNENYSRVLAVSKHYNLIARERNYMGKSMYLPVLYCYSTLASYLEGQITSEKFIDSIVATVQQLKGHKYKSGKIRELLIEMGEIAPLDIKKIRMLLEL